MGKKTIIYFGGLELPDKNAAASRVLNNAKAIREAGCQVVLIGVSQDCDPDIQNTKTVYAGFDCWTMHFRTNRGRFSRLVNVAQLHAILRLYPDTAAVILYNYPALGLYRFMRHCRKAGIALLADCTEWYLASGKNPAVRTVKWLDTYLRMTVLQKKTDGVICISRFLENYYQNTVKTLYLPPLIDRQDGIWQSERGMDDACVRLVYSGSPGRRKDRIDQIIEGLYALRERSFLFWVVGITEAEYLAYYPQHKPILAGLSGKVVFLGRVSHQEAVSYVRRADFSVFFREHNRISAAGFPTKFVEAMSAGTPVITNMTSNLADYLADGKNGFFAEQHGGVQATLAMAVSLDRETIGKMRANCNAATFDYRSYIQAVKKFLEGILYDKRKTENYDHI